MASLAIIDTGYLNITDSGTQADTIVNSGSAISMKNVSANFQTGSEVDSSPIINSLSIPNAGFGSVLPESIVLTGVLDRNVAADMDSMVLLRDLTRTYGVKVLYYTDTTDGYRDISDSLGDENKDDIHKTSLFSGTATPHFHVRFTNFQVSEAPNNMLSFTLEGVTTI